MLVIKQDVTTFGYCLKRVRVSLQLVLLTTKDFRVDFIRISWRSISKYAFSFWVVNKLILRKTTNSNFLSNYSLLYAEILTICVSFAFPNSFLFCVRFHELRKQ